MVFQSSGNIKIHQDTRRQPDNEQMSLMADGPDFMAGGIQVSSRCLTTIFNYTGRVGVQER
jgi:hypothetical protein